MKRKWTVRELRLLRRDYPNKPTSRTARALGRSLTATYQRALIEGLSKSAAYLASDASGRLNKLSETGRVYRFRKGHKTWNKGLHIDNGGKVSQFTMGHRPQTWRPVGSERTDRDGILWRKVRDTRSRSDWKAVHVIAWEAANGPLPPGKFVIFADGDHGNFDPPNLIAVTRAENMRRNTYHRYPKAVANLIQLRGALNRQINKRERNGQHDR